LAAKNTPLHPVVYQAARWTLNFLRAAPELIMGIIFVAAVGFGPLPGVLALGLHSVSLVGAGGIGIELKVSMDMFEYAEASMIIICIFLLVLLVERLSSLARHRII
jgi:ABC-type phosphate/phosphonate transport system permease subunit